MYIYICMMLMREAGVLVYAYAYESMVVGDMLTASPPCKYIKAR
jgi:hypothetical protein